MSTIRMCPNGHSIPPRDTVCPVCGTLGGGDAVPAPPLPVDRPEVPGYQILGELGRGGMGVVYKARQVQADRVVALGRREGPCRKRRTGLRSLWTRLGAG